VAGGTSGEGCGPGAPECSLGSNPSSKPFLTLPTSCGTAQPFQVRANSWASETFTPWLAFYSHDSGDTPVGFSGCEGLAFGPTLTTSPDTSDADTPAGMTVELKPSTGGLEEPEGASSADIMNTKVTLPAGLVISPGQAAGLQACQAAQDGLTTPAEEAEGKEDNGPPSCPLASKVGTVRARTPLLEGAEEKELEGNIYVLQSNPPDLKLLVAPQADGVYIKQVLDVHLDETTGQLTATAASFPQAPVSDVRLSFSGGAQAALATPTGCGTYTTTSDFTPWASPFVADVFPSASFAVTRGPGGGPCPASPLPFSPGLIAGSTTDQAGGFTSFSLLLQTADAQQRISMLQFKFPPGFSGMLSKVALCPEPQASQGECSSASQIGHATVASGPGPYPLVIPQPGKPESPMYLTGPYEGAPFGLAIVTHVIAGPFNLGTIVTRAKIEIDPHTAQITITTDPLPQIIDGVPTDLRTINAIADRPGFMFNPTSCNETAFTGIATSAQATSTAISSRFQIGSCQSLKFAPKFSANTAGAAHPNGPGASFHVRVLAKEGPTGSGQASGEANIKRVEVQLPKLLPARLTTLQKSCTQAQFSANPAGCPEFSFVGTATARTPVLANPLTGPAILVSHGGAQFPDLVIVLQGEGIVLDLVGNTAIKKGITFSKFETVPDAPVSSFELDLPQSPHSALASPNGNLCGQSLVMPTFMEAQNGAQLSQNTIIEVTGCGPKISITKKRAVSGAVNVTVKTSVKGSVTITGHGLRKTTRTLTPGSHTIRVALTGAGKTARSHRSRIRVRAVLKAGKKQASSSSSFKF